MGVVVRGMSESVPQVEAAAIVETKTSWADDWEARPEAELMNLTAASAGQDLPLCEFRTHYGSVKHPWKTAFASEEPLNLLDCWVRIRLAADNQMHVLFVGRVESETREDLGGGTGRQTWTAAGGRRLLQKIHLSRSWWATLTAPNEIGWLPDFNIRDDRRMLVGNRSASTHEAPNGEDTYIFGGGSQWTHRQAVEYLLAWYADRSAENGPSWRLAGQADILAAMTTSVVFGEVETLDEMLLRLIPTQLGVDWTVRPDGDAGFEVFVFSLATVDYSWSGGTVKANSARVELDTGQRSMQISQIVRTAGQRYGTIRVIGRRMVTACSMRMSDQTLKAGWTDDLVNEYRNAAGGDDKERDEVRAGERYRPVFQLFLPGGLWTAAAVTPTLDDDGEFMASGGGSAQGMVRRILTWLPMLEGHDYDPLKLGSGPTHYNDTDEYPDFLPPMVWLQDPESGRYLPAETLGVSVSLAKAGAGLLLQANPNHLLALNHWAGHTGSADDPKYDYDTIVATVAVETDARLALVHKLSEDDGSVIDVQVPDAELWLVAEHTAIKTNDQGGLDSLVRDPTTVPPIEPPFVVRDDRPRMHLVMAGAIARYGACRDRSSIHVRGLIPWADLVGQVLVVKDPDGRVQAEAVITAVEFHAALMPMTVVRTGYNR